MQAGKYFCSAVDWLEAYFKVDCKKRWQKYY